MFWRKLSSYCGRLWAITLIACVSLPVFSNSDAIMAIAETYRLPPSIFQISDEEIDFNLEQFGSHIAFDEALSKAMACFFQNHNGVDAPLQIVMDEYGLGYFMSQIRLRTLMNRSGTIISLVDSTERKDDVADYWIFSLRVPALAHDYQYWAIVDREDPNAQCECFGFN